MFKAVTLNGTTYPDGFSTLHEFYMQDWGDRLRIFHGCPSVWKDVTFRNMRASGAFLVATMAKPSISKFFLALNWKIPAL
ncbi:MAG: hypothetical protein MJY45_06460 [Bacteroidales bacterium]|nr:hypothetical protein [Bacteroidales bacterium]